jgi:23S rRNA pseudouridine1911/1915/1917 synthase
VQNTNNNLGKSIPKGKDLLLSVSESAGLLEFLLNQIPGKSRNNIKSLLTHREVTVDGTVITQHDYNLQKGQIVCIEKTATRFKINENIPDIIYEDVDFIVINKPAGLVTVSTDNEKENTAYRFVTDYIRMKNPSNRVFVVHRLDRDTSGVLLFAKTEKIKFALQDNWNSLVDERGYIAVVEGVLTEKNGTVHSWLNQTKTLLVYSSYKPGDGLEAITNYSVIKEKNNYSLLDIRLQTGRKNQIRVHMKDIGHSVAGDKKYGAKTDPFKRLALHAYKLEIIHPFSKKPMHFETSVPECFHKVL